MSLRKRKLFSLFWNATFFMNRRFCSAKRQWILLLPISLTVIYLFLKETNKYPDFTKTNSAVEYQLRELVSRDRGTGCEMPILDPFSNEILKFDTLTPKITCGDEAWVDCYKSECFVTNQTLSKLKTVICTYRDIIFVRDDYQYLSEPIEIIGMGKYQLVNSDHVKVSCTGTNVREWGIITSFWVGNRAGLRPVPSSKDSSINILIIMLHSTSRNGFIRRMPASYKVLTEELQAVVLKSYNIVGDATAGALFPLFTGHMELELDDARKMTGNNKYVDLNPFLFHKLKENGYKTAYFEEMPWVGTFQNRFNGFEQQPTDHYLRPFFMEEFKGHEGKSRQKYCVGVELSHRFLLNLTDQFFETEGKKFCLTHIVEISHDDFNMITVADEDLVSFLRSFKNDGRLKDTMLIVMGDHGAMFTAIRKFDQGKVEEKLLCPAIRDTYQGKVEERLPFVSIVLPEKLKVERPDVAKNLKANVDVLTTHYDMHTSLLDVLGLKNYRNRYKVPGSTLERGLSFLDPVPNSRSCAEAGIMPHWCACTKWHNVSQSDTIYMKAAVALAGYIDSITEEERSLCAERKLLKIEWVLHQSPNKKMLGYNNIKEVDRYFGKYDESTKGRAAYEYYQVKIVMSPGNSVFEGSLQYIVKYDYFDLSERYISRVNAYGDEPKCVSATHPHLDKYCYCNDRFRNKQLDDIIYVY